jgi:hypothetical protein
MKIWFGYDDVIYRGDITHQKNHYYYNRYENISVPINGHNIMHETSSLTSSKRVDHLTVSNQQYPFDTLLYNNGLTIERGSACDLIKQNKKFVYILAPKYIMRLHSNIIPGAMRKIDNEWLYHFNYLMTVLSVDHITHINNGKCLFIINDISECSWYTHDMLKSLRLMCGEIGLNYSKILILTSNICNIKNVNVEKSGINVQYWQYWESAVKHLLCGSDIPYQNIKKPSRYKFLLLNSKPRRHRFYLCYKLWQLDKNFSNNFCVSLDKVPINELYTCHDYAARDGFYNSISFFNDISEDVCINLNNFLQHLPFTTVYDMQFIETKLKNKLKSRQYVCNFNNITEFFSIDHWDNIPEEMIYNTDIHIVTESLMEIKNTTEYSHLFLTEKTFKPIALKAPFIIAAQPGALAHLRSNGYRTFHECWNEDYDAIEDPQKRLDSIIETVLYIANASTTAYSDIIRRAYEIAEYNYNIFIKRIPEKTVIDTVKDFFTEV